MLALLKWSNKDLCWWDIADYIEPAWESGDALSFEQLFGSTEDTLGAEVVSSHNNENVVKLTRQWIE